MTQISSGTALGTTIHVANEPAPSTTPPSQSRTPDELAAAVVQPGERVTLSTALQSDHRATPIAPITSHRHKPATAWQVLELQKDDANNYSFLQKNTSAYIQPPIDGRFLYVILVADPERIFVGAPIGSRSANDVTFAIEGHTSITYSRDVLYAGELLLRNGKLQQWNNDSGHYRPSAELRHTNLRPALQRLLPEHLFARRWITDDDISPPPDPRPRAANRRAPTANEIRAFAQLGEDAGTQVRPFGPHALSSQQSENGLLLAHALATRIKPPHDYLPVRGHTPSASELTVLRQSLASDRFTAHLNTLEAPDSSAPPNLDEALKQWDYRQRIDSIGAHIDSLPFSAQRLRDLPVYLAVQSGATHLLLDMPQGSASIWVDHSGATPRYGLLDPALGSIDGIPDHTTLDTILSQHFSNAHAANQTTTVYTITSEAADRLAGTYPIPELLGDKHYSARDLLALQDRRDGLLRLGTQEIARTKLHDMGAMLDNRAIDATSLQRATLAGDLSNRLQFDGATLQHQFKTDDNAGRLTDLLYDIGTSRTTPATTPVIRNPEGSDGKWGIQMNAVLALAGEAGQKARHDAAQPKRNIFTYLLRRDANDRSAPPAVPAHQIKGVSAMTQIQSGTTFATTRPAANEKISPATPSQSGAANGLAAAVPPPVPADRVTLSSSLPSDSHATPIAAVTPHLHDPAAPWQILELQKNAGNNYSFLQKNDAAYVQPRVDGKFNYVILADDPQRIYVGAPPGLSSSNDAEFSLQGHTSMTAGKDVVYAGEVLFSNGKLVQWNNESGHYKPAAELRLANLGPVLQRLLPEHLFSHTWIPSHAEPDLLPSAPNRRTPDASDISAFNQLGADAGARVRPFGLHALSSYQSENGLLLAHALATQIKPPQNYLPMRGHTPSASELTGLRQSLASDRFTAHLNTLEAPDSNAIPNLDEALKQWDYRQRLDSIGAHIDDLPFSAQRLRDLPAYLAVQTSTTHLLLDMPQGSASIWVDRSGATPRYGLVDPALGIIEGISDHTTLDTILSQHFSAAYAANQTTTAYTITGEAADRLTGTYQIPDLLGDKHYNARDMLALQDRRDGLLRLGAQEIARTKLYDMGAMLDNQAIDAASLQRTTLAGDLSNRLQFDGATLQHQFKTDGNADRMTDLLYDIGTSRTTAATGPVILKPDATDGNWGSQMNVVLTLAGKVGQKARNDAMQTKRNLFTYLLPGGGAVNHTGVGLQAFGVYNSIRGIKDAVARGDTTDIAINSAGLAAEGLSLGAEKGIVKLGNYLQKGSVSSFNAFAKTSIGSKLGGTHALGTNIGRTASGVGVLITTPFDIYSAYSSFSQAATSQGKAAQDHYVNGGLAVVGATSSIALAGAAFAGVAAAGPIGMAVGAALAIGGGIYSSARYVEDLDAHANLSGWEKFVTGAASFVGSGASQEIEDRVAISKGQENYDSGKQQMLRKFLGQSRQYGEAIFGNALITAQAPLMHRSAPNQHGLRKKIVTQRPAIVTDSGADRINALHGTSHLKNRVTAPATNGDAVYWATGDGHDRLTGVGWRSNTFDLGQGKKEVQGGWQNDRIRLTTGVTNGSHFNGGDGDDTLDLSAAAPTSGTNGKRSFVVKLPPTNATEAVSAELYWQDNELRTSGAPKSRPVETASGHVATRGQRATLDSIENVITAKNARTKINGNDKDNLFVLNGRNDSVRGGAGNDIYVVNGGGTVKIMAGDGDNRYQIARAANIVEISTAQQSTSTELNLAWNLDEITVQAIDGNLEILLGRKRQKTMRLQDASQPISNQWAASQQTVRVVDGKREVLLTRDHQKKIRLQDVFHQATNGQWQARQAEGALRILTRDGYLLTPVLSSRPTADDGLLQIIASISPHRLPTATAR